MSIARAEVVVDASPEEVWRVVSDPDNLLHWDRRVAGVTDVSQDEFTAGLTYKTELRFMGVHGTVGVEVLEADPPHFARLRLSGPLDATVTTRITALEDGRSLLEHEVDYRLRGALGLFAARSLKLLGGADFALKRGTIAQKRQVEAGP